jgi:hypothetical protein
MKNISTLSVCILLVCGSLGLAQEAGQVGINMRVDPAPRIGLTYHLSQKFALRPYVGFTLGSVEADNEFIPRNQQGLLDPVVIESEREESTSRFTVGLGLLFYVHKSRSLSVYTGANFSYTRDTVEVEVSWRDRGWTDRVEVFGGNALLGLQCELLDNLGIFGEVGLGYSSGTYEHENNNEATRNTSRWGLTNSGIGLVFYF